jgi:hypothetical protein
MNPRAPSDCGGHDLEHWSLNRYLTFERYFRAATRLDAKITAAQIAELRAEVWRVPVTQTTIGVSTIAFGPLK